MFAEASLTANGGGSGAVTRPTLRRTGNLHTRTISLLSSFRSKSTSTRGGDEHPESIRSSEFGAQVSSGGELAQRFQFDSDSRIQCVSFGGQRQKSEMEVDLDQYLGLAITTSEYDSSDYQIGGRKKTEQALVCYHRPTQINYELRESSTANRGHQSRVSTSSSSLFHHPSSSSSPFLGHTTLWSPALLSEEVFSSAVDTDSIYSQCSNSSSTLSVASSALTQPHSPCEEIKQKIWRVSSADQAPALMAPFVYA